MIEVHPFSGFLLGLIFIVVALYAMGYRIEYEIDERPKKPKKNEDGEEPPNDGEKPSDREKSSDSGEDHP